MPSFASCLTQGKSPPPPSLFPDGKSLPLHACFFLEHFHRIPLHCQSSFAHTFLLKSFALCTLFVANWILQGVVDYSVFFLAAIKVRTFPDLTSDPHFGVWYAFFCYLWGYFTPFNHMKSMSKSSRASSTQYLSCFLYYSYALYCFKQIFHERAICNIYITLIHLSY